MSCTNPDMEKLIRRTIALGKQKKNNHVGWKVDEGNDGVSDTVPGTGE